MCEKKVCKCACVASGKVLPLVITNREEKKMTTYTEADATKAIIKARTSMLMSTLRMNFPRVAFSGRTTKINGRATFTVTYEGPIELMTLAAIIEEYENSFLSITARGVTREWI
jgi:hypothetical protein